MIELVHQQRSMFGDEWTPEDRSILRDSSAALTMAVHDMRDAIEIRSHVYMGSYAARLTAASRGKV